MHNYIKIICLVFTVLLSSCNSNGGNILTKNMNKGSSIDEVAKAKNVTIEETQSKNKENVSSNDEELKLTFIIEKKKDKKAQDKEDDSSDDDDESSTEDDEEDEEDDEEDDDEKVFNEEDYDVFELAIPSCDITIEDFIKYIKNKKKREVTKVLFKSSMKYGFLDGKKKLRDYGIVSSGKVKKNLYGHILELKIDRDAEGRETNLVNITEIKMKKSQKKIDVERFYIHENSFNPQKWEKDEKSDNISAGDIDFVGVVLYGKEDISKKWMVNGMEFQTGCILLKKYKNIKNLQSDYGIYGRVFKSVFEVEPDDIVCSGFSYTFDDEKPNWNYESETINRKLDLFHNIGHGDQKMNKLEQQSISNALENWIRHKKKETKVDSQLAVLLMSKKNQLKQLEELLTNLNKELEELKTKDIDNEYESGVTVGERKNFVESEIQKCISYKKKLEK